MRACICIATSKCTCTCYSNVSSVVVLYSKFGSELSFKKVYQLTRETEAVFFYKYIYTFTYIQI